MWLPGSSFQGRDSGNSISTQDSYTGGAFAHEVHHVIQVGQNGMFPIQAFMEQLGGNPYGYDPNAPILPQFNNGGVEVQGQIIQDIIQGALGNNGVIQGKFQDTYGEILKRCKCKNGKK